MATTTTSKATQATRSGTDTTVEIDVETLTRAVENVGRHHLASRVVSAPVRRGWLNVTYTGRENVAPHGAVILAANHYAFIDSLLLMYSLDRPVAFLGKAEYLANPVAAKLFPAAGMLPLDRSGRKARITLDRAQEILRDGGIIGVHPEGTRSRDGLLGPGHQGVAQMALRANAPVVPVGIIGTDLAQPVGKKLPNFRADIEIRFGAPIGVSRWASARRSARSRAELTEEIMESIAALSGQQRRTSL